MMCIDDNEVCWSTLALTVSTRIVTNHYLSTTRLIVGQDLL